MDEITGLPLPNGVPRRRATDDTVSALVEALSGAVSSRGAEMFCLGVVITDRTCLVRVTWTEGEGHAKEERTVDRFADRRLCRLARHDHLAMLVREMCDEIREGVDDGRGG